MTDRADEFRKAAADCLALARTATDAATRSELLLMAQKWIDLTTSPPGEGYFDSVLRNYNDDKMSRP
jgi:hypothetical protein